MKIKRSFLVFAGLCSIYSMAYSVQYPSDNIWEGFVVGGYLGGIRDTVDFTTNAGDVRGAPLFSYFQSSADINSVNLNGTGSLNSNSVLGGIQAGSNMLVGHFLYGVVVDLGAMHLNNSTNVTQVPLPSTPFVTYNLSDNTSSKWLFTARASLGYIVNNWISVYGTGGLAVSHVAFNREYSDTSNPGTIFTATKDANKGGWTAGAGLQFPFSPHLYINAEYLYVEFQPHKTSGLLTCAGGADVCSSIMSTSAALSNNLLKLGVNYQF